MFTDNKAVETQSSRAIYDKRVISLDFLYEIGALLISYGNQICTCSVGDNAVSLEASLRGARNTLIEGIREFKKMEGSVDG